MRSLRAKLRSRKERNSSPLASSVNRLAVDDLNANVSTSGEEIKLPNPNNNLEHPASALASSSVAADRAEKYGLIPLNSLHSSSEDAINGETYPIDIVAIHGITGDALDTWTHENGKIWLRDFLPGDLPGARIFSFGYPAEVVFSRSVANLDTFCRSLLESLKKERGREEVRSSEVSVY